MNFQYYNAKTHIADIVTEIKSKDGLEVPTTPSVFTRPSPFRLSLVLAFEQSYEG
jgi:hypothetical protein